MSDFDPKSVDWHRLRHRKIQMSVAVIFLLSWLIIGIAAVSPFRGLIAAMVVTLLGGGMLLWNSAPQVEATHPEAEVPLHEPVPMEGTLSHLGKGIIPVWVR